MAVMLDKVPFEDALTMTGFSKFNYLIFLLSGSIIFGMVFETFSVAYLVPVSACELNTTSAQQGIMAAVPLIGIIATSHIWGYLADTRGRRKVLIISMVLGFLTGASATLSPNWIVFSVLKFLSSSAVAGSYPLALTLLSECTLAARRNTMILLTSTIFLSGTGFMAAISIPILPLDFSYPIPTLGIVFCPWRLLNLIFCAPCIISAIGLYFAFESPKYLLSIGQDEQALETLKGIYVINNGKDRDSYMVKSVVLDEQSVVQHKTFWSSLVAQTLPLFKPPFLYNTILLSVIFVIVYICINPYMVWLPFIADGFMRAVENGADGMTFCDMLRSSRSNETAYQEENNCALNQTAMSLVFGVGLFLAIFNVVLSGVINFISRKTLLISVQIVAGTAALCINASSIWILNAILFIIFLSGIFNFGFLSTFSVDIFPTYVKAMAVCLTLMIGRGSAVLGINILKSLLDNHCEASFYIFGAITFLGGIIGFLLPSDEKIREQKKCAET